MNRSRCLIALVSLVCSLCGCNDEATPKDTINLTPVPNTDAQGPSPTNDAITDMGQPTDAAEITCEPGGGQWQAGEPIFENRTQPWGLEGIRGEYFSVTDFNHDGWADLIVRAGGGEDDFSEGGQRNKWLLRNMGDGTFLDVTEVSGIFTSRLDPDPSFGRAAKVVISGDVDNDGDLDIYLGHGRTDPDNADSETSELMINNGDETFSLGPAQSDARFLDRPSNPAGASFVDFNQDGHLDLWVVHNELPGLIPMPDSLLEGDGTGAFRDVTIAKGLSTLTWNSLFALNGALAHSWGWGSTACDLDSDGLPELMAASYGRSPNHLWQGGYVGENVQFTNRSIESGYAFDHREDWTDDLSAQCFCADEPEADECDRCPTPDPQICDGLRRAFGENYRWGHDYSREPFRLGGVTGTTVCADLDGDGDLDLVNFEIVHGDTGLSSDPTEVLINEGGDALSFSRPGSEETGFRPRNEGPFWDQGDMTGAVFDFDNDGHLDIYVGAAEYAGNRGLLFHHTEPLRFQEVHTDDFFEHWRAHGVAVADFDRDGDIDMLVGHSRFRCEGFEGTECQPTTQVQFFENQLGNRNHWLQVELENEGGPLIGTQVEVRTRDWVQLQEVDGGHGRNSMQRDPVLHFGMGDGCSAQLTIRWPGGQSSTHEVVSLNQRVRITRPEVE